MSGFGLGGFGTGFLQGFETMGQDFARRGIVAADRQRQAREDRQLQLEEELSRLREERAQKESDAALAARGVQTDADRMKLGALPKLLDQEVTGGQLRNQGQATQNRVEELKAGVLPQQLQQDVKGGELRNAGLETQTTADRIRLGALPQQVQQEVTAGALKNQGQATQNQAESLKVAALPGQLDRQATAQSLDNQGQSIKVAESQTERDQAKQREQVRQGLGAAVGRIDAGQGTPEDFALMQRHAPLLEIVKNPQLPQDLSVLHGAIQTAAQAGGEVAPFNTPEVLGALNRTFGPAVNVTRGMPLDPEGKTVVGHSELVGMVRHPSENKIGFKVIVQPEPNPQRKAELEQALSTANPQQRDALETELHPPAYQTDLTDGRLPVAQGGAMKWFSPEEVQKVMTGLAGVGQLQAAYPDMAQKLHAMQGSLERGEWPGSEQEGLSVSDQVKLGQLDLNRRDSERKDKQFEADEAARKERSGQNKIKTDLEIKQLAQQRAQAEETARLNKEKAERELKESAQRMTAAKRKQFQDAYHDAVNLIDKKYGAADPLTGKLSFEGDAGLKAADEKTAVAKMLHRHPQLSGPEALERALQPKPSAASVGTGGASPAPQAASGGVRGGGVSAPLSEERKAALKTQFGFGQ